MIAAPTNVRIGLGAPPQPGQHGYFESLLARPDTWHAYSLRPVALRGIESPHYGKQLLRRADGGYAQSNDTPLFVTYDPANDTDPRRQDAAKVLIPATENSLPNQVRLPIGTENGRTYILTWDAWYGAEFRFAHAQIGNYKTFQLDTGTLSGTPNIWVEINNAWDQAPKVAGALKGRYYPDGIKPAGPGVTLNPFGPQLVSFAMATETWTRYWVRIEQRVAGDSWTRISLWVADVTRGPIQLWDRLAVTDLGGILKFWLEYNTSTNAVVAGRGPMTSYVRNVWIGRDVTNATTLLMRPN